MNKAKMNRMRLMIAILFVLAVLAILLAPRGGASGYDGGYPISWGYPPPVVGTPTAWGYPAPVTPTADPWCEEMRLLGKNPPWWCPPWNTTPVVGEAAVTAVSEPEATETPVAILKVGGRQKGRGR